MPQLRIAFLTAVKNAVSDMKYTGCFSNAAELDEHDGRFLKKVLSLTTPLYDEFDTGTILRDISRIVYKLSKRPMVFMMDEYDSPIAYAAEHGCHDEAVGAFLKLSKRPMVFMMDEYDSPIAYAAEHGCHDEAVGAFLKNNEFVEASLIVGITRFGDTGYLSEVDNLSVYTLRDRKYSTSCMFTAEETKEQTEKYKQPSRPEPPMSFEDLTQWYEGYYTADGQRLYNTCSS
ncbi:hypothetical protein FA95DRAFT_1572097 [Auriscalpium vulgare]|uniref:Uncharacterized protein n=1 Tax=Auriscalpium vulgare TaxID=40419 RepID=A0ACB8RVL7_9AGAM|nr:hypothetical protein FA95DRAFT_1572097 [Auriscalpium vulgare]